MEAPASPAPIYPNETVDFRASNQERSNLVTTIDWSHSFTPTIINDFRYTYGKRLFTTRGLGTGSGLNGQLGVPNVDPEFFARST